MRQYRSLSWPRRLCFCFQRFPFLGRFFHAASFRDPSLSHPNCRGLGFFHCLVSAVCSFLSISAAFSLRSSVALFLSQFRSVLLCTVRLLGFSMTDSLIWVSAQLPHPVPTEFLRSDVVARCEAPKCEGDPRSPPLGSATCSTIAAKIITVLTRYRPIVLESI